MSAQGVPVKQASGFLIYSPLGAGTKWVDGWVLAGVGVS